MRHPRPFLQLVGIPPRGAASVDAFCSGRCDQAGSGANTRVVSAGEAARARAWACGGRDGWRPGGVVPAGWSGKPSGCISLRHPRLRAPLVPPPPFAQARYAHDEQHGISEGPANNTYTSGHSWLLSSVNAASDRRSLRARNDGSGVRAPCLAGNCTLSACARHPGSHASSQDGTTTTCNAYKFARLWR